MYACTYTSTHTLYVYDSYFLTGYRFYDENNRVHSRIEFVHQIAERDKGLYIIWHLLVSHVEGLRN